MNNDKTHHRQKEEDRAMGSFFDREDPSQMTATAPPFNPLAGGNPQSPPSEGNYQEGKVEGENAEGEKSGKEKETKSGKTKGLATKYTLWSHSNSLPLGKSRGGLSSGISGAKASVSVTLARTSAKSKGPGKRKMFAPPSTSINLSPDAQKGAWDRMALSLGKFDPFSGESMSVLGVKLKLSGPALSLSEKGLSANVISLSGSMKVDKKMLDEVKWNWLKAGLSPYTHNLIESGEWAINVSLSTSISFSPLEFLKLKKLKKLENLVKSQADKIDDISKQIQAQRKKIEQIRKQIHASVKKGMPSAKGRQIDDVTRALNDAMNRWVKGDIDLAEARKLGLDEGDLAKINEIKKINKGITASKREIAKSRKVIQQCKSKVAKLSGKLKSWWGKSAAKTIAGRTAKIATRAIKIGSVLFDLYDLLKMAKHIQSIGQANGEDAGLFDPVQNLQPGDEHQEGGKLRERPDHPGNTPDSETTQTEGKTGDGIEPHEDSSLEEANQDEKEAPEVENQPEKEVENPGMPLPPEVKTENKKGKLKPVEKESIDQLKEKPHVWEYFQKINGKGTEFGDNHVRRLYAILHDITKEELEILVKGDGPQPRKLTPEEFLLALEMKLESLRGSTVPLSGEDAPAPAGKKPEAKPKGEGDGAGPGKTKTVKASDVNHDEVRLIEMSEKQKEAKIEARYKCVYSISGELQDLEVGKDIEIKLAGKFWHSKEKIFHSFRAWEKPFTIEFTNKTHIIITPKNSFFFKKDSKLYKFESGKRIKILRENIFLSK